MVYDAAENPTADSSGSRMATVLLVVHLMIAAALVGVVLLQRSEGGALGIGGGGGGGFLTGRGTANLLTRVTATLAAAFFLTSILLTVLAQRGGPGGSVFDRAAPPGNGAPAAGDTGGGTPAPQEGRGGILDKLQGAPSGPAVPQTR
jgi:preprotein translocase subunit SecG